MIHRIVGTAGHIDHGKTALVRALTGVDTDRLREEKERGISIDLGFAVLDLPGGLRAGVVDVPGHERFIRNMLAGAHGVDLALLVVAADDGVMPQTEEHLEIVHLLGVSAGVVAITKCDLVDEDRIAEVIDETSLLLEGTGLEGAPAIAVSAATGRGLGALQEALARGLDTLRRPRRRGPFRMPIDRSFRLRGHGFVVTGTSVAGTVAPGDTVAIAPGACTARVRTARVRAVEVHGAPLERAFAGQRVALNLVGPDLVDIRRGHVITDPRLACSTDRLDARVEIRRLARRPVPNRSRVRLHLGTASVLARLVLLGGRSALAPGETGHVQLVSPEAIAAFAGDRFVLRSGTADRTLGGGVVLLPQAPPHRARDTGVTRHLEALERGSTEARVLALLELDLRFALPIDEIARTLSLDPRAVGAVATHDTIEALPSRESPEVLTTRGRWTAWISSVERLLADAVDRKETRGGVEMEVVRSQLAAALSPRLFRNVVERLVAEKRLVRTDQFLHLHSHAPPAADPADERILTVLREAGVGLPAPEIIGRRASLSVDRVRERLRSLEKDGAVVRIATGLYAHPEVLDDVQRRVADHVGRNGSMTASEFRDLIGSTRKFAIPILEHLDRIGFTVRDGDRRRLRPQASGSR